MTHILPKRAPDPARAATDRQTETGLNTSISRVLAIGLLAAVVLLLVGVVLALARPDLPLVRKTSIADLPRALASFEPGGFFDLGLFVLVATPVARVVALGLGFARRRSWVFCCFSLIVLAVHGLSAFLGLRA
jgi:uncharacterized membrane protein